MANLYITEQGAVLRKTGERVFVEKDEKVLLDVPCAKLDTILVFGSVLITTQALSELLERGIEVALLTRHGRLKGQLTPVKAKNVILRMQQFRRSQDPAYALETARVIVDAKIHCAIEQIERHRSNYPDPVLTKAIDQLRQHRDRLAGAETIDAINGMEGIAARDYFAAFAVMNRSELAFPGRRKYPATDPVNALLSFGYTLVTNDLWSLLDAMGFDPYIGFLHQLDYGRPSLALDLMEEFRHSMVDRFTLGLLNKRVFTEKDFQSLSRSELRSCGPAGGEKLSRRILARDGLQRYFTEWENWISNERVMIEGKRNSFRQCFRRQAEKLAHAIETGELYVPFRG